MQRPHADRRRLVALYAATLLLSATLLFSIQPLFAKMVLPLLGSAPSVWITFMLFFQTALLAGYAYAHVVPRRIGWRRYALVHLAIMAMGASVLPIAVPRNWVPPPSGSPSWWLLSLLVVGVGAPVFVVSTSAPLLQRWFSLTGHPHARDPYFLYGASNIGSMGALLAYPVAIEPTLHLTQQARIWSIGYVALIAFTALAALALWRSPPAEARAREERIALSRARRARWVVLAAVPSSLMLGVTNYFTAEVSPIPLFWVVPLALYLATFVIAFSSSRGRSLRRAERALPLLIAGLLVTIQQEVTGPLGLLVLLHLVVLFLTALAAHGRLAQDRPPVGNLTEFYLWLAVGGIVGGAFNALIAPAVFTGYLEYPLVLVAAAAIVAWRARWSWRVPAMACALLGVIVAGGTEPIFGVYRPLAASRDFFGPIAVEQRAGSRVLYHGRTLHGAQLTANPLEPIAYYSREGPLGEIVERLTPLTGRIGVIGLGAGATACLGEPTQRFTFYEISPAVARIAADPSLFTYLQDCRPRSDVVIGDGRLMLALEPDRAFNLITVDAFSSDAIPMHLITREAVALYESKLAPSGVLAFHISNRYLDLAPPLADVAAAAGMSIIGRAGAEGAPGSGILASIWVAMARAPADLQPLYDDERWKRLEGDAARAWTDDYSNLLRAMSWR